MSQSTGRRIGPYVLEEKLGAGGMGVVYRATDSILDRPVAIKMMLPAEGLGDGVNLDEMQARFLREAKAAARIQSRHVASVLHFGQDVNDEGETIAYIVMEFLKGKRLDKVINRDGPLSPSRAVHIGTQIAKGMAAAHDLGIVHRDLKPANIMLVEEEGDPDFVKILDFGVAKLTHDQQTHALTQAGAFLGTLAFMAPEQVSGGEVDARADIYSLGIILYRMFTGVPVWDADSLSDIVRHQLSSRPPSMAERVAAPLFTAAHDAVVLRCLEKAPAARYQTMLDLAAALRAAEDAPSAMVGGTVATVAASTPPTTGTPSRERHGDGMDTSPTSASPRARHRRRLSPTTTASSPRAAARPGSSRCRRQRRHRRRQLRHQPGSTCPGRLRRRCRLLPARWAWSSASSRRRRWVESSWRPSSGGARRRPPPPPHQPRRGRHLRHRHHLRRSPSRRQQRPRQSLYRLCRRQRRRPHRQRPRRRHHRRRGRQRSRLRRAPRRRGRRRTLSPP
jgi:serine/threonine-protein kinase